MLEEHQFDKIVFNKYFLFLLFFIFHFVLIFQGFDVTDYGDTFTQQYLLLEHPLSIDQYNAMFFLSDFVGGHLTPSNRWTKSILGETRRGSSLLSMHLRSVLDP